MLLSLSLCFSPRFQQQTNLVRGPVPVSCLSTQTLSWDQNPAQLRIPVVSPFKQRPVSEMEAVKVYRRVKTLTSTLAVEVGKYDTARYDMCTILYDTEQG